MPPPHPNGHNRGREPEGLVCCLRSDLFPTVYSRNIPDRECISPLSPALWFSLIYGCSMTICLYLHFEAVTGLSASKGFCKEPHRCSRWDKASQCKGASPWQHRCSLLHGPQPWDLGLAVGLSCLAVTIADPCCWMAFRGKATEADPTTWCWADWRGHSGKRFEVTTNLGGIAAEV